MNWNTYQITELINNESYRIIDQQGFHVLVQFIDGKFISKAFGEVNAKRDIKGNIYIFK